MSMLLLSKVRPPQPSVFYFVIDVSYSAVQSGESYVYLSTCFLVYEASSLFPTPSGILGVTCRLLLDHLHKLPGDGRTMVGFLTVDSSMHFYNLKVTLPQIERDHECDFATIKFCFILYDYMCMIKINLFLQADLTQPQMLVISDLDGLWHSLLHVCTVEHTKRAKK